MTCIECFEEENIINIEFPIENNHLKCLEFAISNITNDDWSYYIKLAISKENIDILNYLYENKNKCKNFWIYLHTDKDIDKNPFISAIIKENLKIVDWLYIHNCPYNNDILYTSLLVGNKKIINYILINCHFDIYDDTLYEAALMFYDDIYMFGEYEFKKRTEEECLELIKILINNNIKYNKNDIINILKLKEYYKIIEYFEILNNKSIDF